MGPQITTSELERRIYTALETYSNVHRGSGHFSMVTTHLFDMAREIVLEHLGLDKKRHAVIFCTPRRAAALHGLLKKGYCQVLSSEDFGLPLGVRAMAVSKKALPKGAPFQTGGGTTRLISRKWTLWAGVPDKFEAGTPSVINIIAFAAELRSRSRKAHGSNPVATDGKWTAYDIFYRDGLHKYQGRELLEILREYVVGKDITVPTSAGAIPYVNLDNAASTPTLEPVWHAFRHALFQDEEVKKEIVQEVRSLTSQLINAPLHDYEILFTSNTTEAINLAAESIGREPSQGFDPVVVGTMLEHTSNDLPWRMLRNHAFLRLNIDSRGLIDLHGMETLLRDYNQEGKHGRKRVVLVTVCGASNVLGVYNDLEAICRTARTYGARVLVDAAQLIAHRTVDVEGWGIDYLAFSGHKTYAPFGTGALVARKGLLNFNPAEMKLIHSSGEENIGGVAALGKAMLLLRRIGMEIIQTEEQELTARTLRGMENIGGLTVYGINTPSSPDFEHKGGVICFTFQKTMSNVIAAELSEGSGIGIRYGCHCAHVLVKHLLGVKPFLEGFQRVMLILFPKMRLPGMARVSFGIGNTLQEADQMLRALEAIGRGQKRPTGGKSTISPEEVRKQMDKFIRGVSEKVYMPRSLDA